MTLPTTAIEISYVLRYGYVALFLIVAAGEAASLLPIGILLVAVGALARTTALDFFTCLIVAALASIASDLIVFLASRHWGRRGSYRRFVERNPIAGRVEAYMARYPRGTVFVSRLVGLASTAVNALAGLSQMPLLTFFVFGLLGDALCCFAYLGAGYFLGVAWQDNARLTTESVGAALLVAAAVYGISLYVRHRAAARNRES